MENASKALLIAGAVLISVLIITLFMWFITSMQQMASFENQQLVSSENEKYNRYFYYLSTKRSGKISFLEVYNLIKKVDDMNKTYGPGTISITYSGLTKSFFTDEDFKFDSNDFYDEYGNYVFEETAKGHKYDKLKNDLYTISFLKYEDGKIKEIMISK